MKTREIPILMTAILVSIPKLACAAEPAATQKSKPQPKPVPVAFQTAGKPPHYVTARPKGALDVSGTTAAGGQTFQLLDLDGTPLKSGDKVQIQFTAGRTSYWHEDKGKVNRTGIRHPDAGCVFVVIKKSAIVQLKTQSGQYVSAQSEGGALVTKSKKSDPTTLFTLVKKG